MGCMHQEYAAVLAAAASDLSAAAASGNSLSFMVGRLSYTFGLTGEHARSNMHSDAIIWLEGTSNQ